jgi:LysM repeat protein
MFEIFLHLSEGGYMVHLSNKRSKTFPKVKWQEVQTMSTFNAAVSSVNQGFSTIPSRQVAHPGGLRLTRRGRLARTLVVLSLAVVAASVFGGKAGAGTDRAASPAAYVTVVVAPGESLWALASQVADGRDVGALVAEIQDVNSLKSVDVVAGTKIRIPLKD